MTVSTLSWTMNVLLNMLGERDGINLLTSETGKTSLEETGADDKDNNNESVMMMKMEEEKEGLSDNLHHALHLHYGSRVKIATSALHNVLGKESCVKW